MSERLPAIGEKRYYMHKEIIVIKVWEHFHLAEIKTLDNEQLSYVDICTLTLEPILTNSISLGLFGGGFK